jgi:predicted nucleotidyltransferase component of viral defense system
MIPKGEILLIATRLKLLPSTIEKDYLLGWLIAAINNHKDLCDEWVFKGGTALKKCYFDHYRFSEDLDFTIKPDFLLEETLLSNIFVQIADWIYRNSGIEIEQSRIKFEQYVNPRGNISCTGSIYCRGPITPKGNHSLQRIKLDLTQDEIIVDAPVRMEIFHRYSDAQKDKMFISCYSYLEIFAEKIRALVERTRPRDLYDVIHLYHKSRHEPVSSRLRDFLMQKCSFKKITFPRIEDLEIHKNDCRNGWDAQLSHQVSELRKFDWYWSELEHFFVWLENAV